jgi:putative ATP-dependent endonuclease of OLD family
MKIVSLKIENFRGIKSANLKFLGHTVFVGDNNTGKSTILEAIDLVLGPERLSKYPVIDEHDFYAGQYLKGAGEAPHIYVEVLISELAEEQLNRFRYHLEWLALPTGTLLASPPIERTDGADVIQVLRVCFRGMYEPDDDDFTGRTFFCSPEVEDGTLEEFKKYDKRECGFLLLRTLRTGSRALSLEKGSLLDIILRLLEIRPKMWETVLSDLRGVPVAEDPELGLSDVLKKVQEAVRSFVPTDWAENPRLRVSTLTRVELRRILTVFMDTGVGDENEPGYAAPFQHQGTGTINTLVLALLVMIADLKQNVIFAMEEPEIAIPPHTQKRIIKNVIGKSAQAIFTSHSPYVLEEFEPKQILVVMRQGGVLSGFPADYPPTIKPKRYRDEFRRRFCEALLARRVLVVEGRTEYDLWPAAARRLNDKKPDDYSTFEALGIAIVNAETDSQVEPLLKFFKTLGKTAYAVYDKQNAEEAKNISAAVDIGFECPEKGIEKLIVSQTKAPALRRFAGKLIESGRWPAKFEKEKPDVSTPEDKLKAVLMDVLIHGKGEGIAADLIVQCDPGEMPAYITESLAKIKKSVEKKS